jgi:hypothetical protein
MRPLSDGIINADFPTVNFHAGAFLFGGFSVVHVFVIDESESAGTTGLLKNQYITLV